MLRKIITIDEEKCVGCGLCVNACKEGAIGMVNGKAKMLRDDYCDGLGNCLPVCPTNAISFEERDTAAFDKESVAENMKSNFQDKSVHSCAGTLSQSITRTGEIQPDIRNNMQGSELKQWPVQIKLVPTTAPYFENANLLVAADCSAFAYANFHNEFMRNKITIIGCPKLDEVDYSEKLTAILKNNNIKSVTVIRMEVPCCGGIERAVTTALKNCGKLIQWRVITISTGGKIIEE